MDDAGAQREVEDAQMPGLFRVFITDGIGNLAMRCYRSIQIAKLTSEIFLSIHLDGRLSRSPIYQGTAEQERQPVSGWDRGSMLSPIVFDRTAPGRKSARDFKN
ncbi:MAG: hypothetical protein HOW97_30330 [Catenulispora sp.]|nr:hypothetical protein [Catenulispora sp.]